MISLNSNITSLKVQSKLSKADNSLSSLFQQLSSGQRINKASDDSAGLAISETLNMKSEIYSQGIRNTNDSVSLLNIAESALASMADIVTRQSELAQQAASGALSSEQRSLLQEENVALREEYNRIRNSAEFNGEALFSIGNGQLDAQTGQSSIGLDYLLREDSLVGLGTYTESIQGIDVQDMVQAGLLIQDLNGDGLDDVVSVYATATAGVNDLHLNVEVFLGQSDGNYSMSSNQIHVEDTGASMSIIESISADFTGTNNNLNVTVEYANINGPAVLHKEVEIDAAGSVNSIYDGGGAADNILVDTGTGDFNGDGVTDFAVINTDALNFSFHTQDTQESDFVNLEQVSTNISTTSGALSALDEFNELLEKISHSRSAAGASLARTEVAIQNLQSQLSEAESARSRIVDVDVAATVADLTRNQILKDGAAAILAQANQQPQIALELLGNAA